MPSVFSLCVVVSLELEGREARCVEWRTFLAGDG